MMHLKTLFTVLIALSYLKSFSQNINGHIKALASQEPLISAVVYDSLSGKGVLTNEHGYFSLALNQSKAVLKISYIGYNLQVLAIDFKRDTFLNVSLKENDALQIVVIIANSYENNAGNGLINLPIEKLNKVPSMGGERDILKALTILPGVSGGDEGTASLIVRGGSNDQNMIVLDGTPIYNTGHLFNFISLFNADAVKKIDFYKSYFPARFGGRLSSVLDINFREGNKNRFEGKLDVGIISSKLLLEGPLSKNRKTSFLFAARSSYLDLFTIGQEKKALAKEPTYGLFGAGSSGAGNDFLGYTFADINFKINHQFNEKNKLFFNVYLGQDIFREAQSVFLTETNQSRSELLNTAIALRSYHVISPRLFFQWGVSYSENRGNFKTEDKTFNIVETPSPPNSPLPPLFSFKLSNVLNTQNQGIIKDVSLNMKADYQLNKRNALHIGADVIRHAYQPNQYFSINNNLKDSIRDTLSYPNAQLHATELGLFIEDAITINKDWQCFTGVRLSAFKYDKVYFNIEPRLSLTYKLPNKLGALNAAITKTAQYNHALIQPGQIVDRTVWVPSTEKIPPQYAWQYGLGWRKSDEEQGFDVSIEAFYKQMSNLSSFQITYNDPSIYNNWEQKVATSGKGESYGLELFAAKNKGKWQGTAAYTLSWNYRQFETINEGRRYPFIYDRRHNLVLTASRDLGKHWKFSSLFTIANGRRFNIPVAKVNATPFTPDYYIYDNANNGQLPVYHRLDVSFAYEKALKNRRILGVNFNIYNAYFHQNAYYLYPDVERVYNGNKVVSQRDVIKTVSLFPILPSINVSYKF